MQYTRVGGISGSVDAHGALHLATTIKGRLLECSHNGSTLPSKRCGCIRISHPRSLACTSRDTGPCEYRDVLRIPALSLSTVEEVTLLSNIGAECQGKFHVRGYVPGVVSGVTMPCSEKVPRYVYPTITGKTPWSTSFKSQQNFPCDIRRQFTGETLHERPGKSGAWLGV